MFRTIWASLGERLRFLLGDAAEPLVPAGSQPIGQRIIECPYIEIPSDTAGEATSASGPNVSIAPSIAPPLSALHAPVAYTGPRLVNLAPEVNLPVASDVGEPSERAMIATIGGSAALGAVEVPPREPDDFLLARRLHSVARLNRPVNLSAPPHVYNRASNQRLKRTRPGCLSPVLARGRQPAFSAPVALAA